MIPKEKYKAVNIKTGEELEFYAKSMHQAKYKFPNKNYIVTKL